MYIFQLMGGLGNQMFQYAAGRALSLKNNIPLKVDFDCPYKHVKYTYNLNVFEEQADQAGFLDLWKAKPKTKIAKRLFMLSGKDYRCNLVKEKKEFTYNEDFFSIPDGSYVSGFFQTEKYFKIFEKEIRRDFNFSKEPSEANKKFIENIQSEQAVSLHIRRGDYVKIKETNEFHGVCSISYYQSAISLIAEKVKDPVFYIFSDDMNWVKENFNISQSHVFVDINDAATNYEDMRLMSLCKHNIIANSSFSWWGAWLNANENKMVIAPKQWMKDPLISTNDLIPENWIRI